MTLPGGSESDKRRYAYCTDCDTNDLTRVASWSEPGLTVWNENWVSLSCVLCKNWAKLGEVNETLFSMSAYTGVLVGNTYCTKHFSPLSMPEWIEKSIVDMIYKVSLVWCGFYSLLRWRYVGLARLQSCTWEYIFKQVQYLYTIWNGDWNCSVREGDRFKSFLICLKKKLCTNNLVSLIWK